MRHRNALWWVHLGTLATVVLWAAVDLQFEPMMGQLESLLVSPLAAVDAATAHVGWQRPAGLIVLLALAMITMTGICLRFVMRSTQGARSVSLQTLLSITAIAALWFAIANHHRWVAWQGKRIRMVTQIDQLESIASPLRIDWPLRDGNLAEMGPFMAYPFGRPTTLILLQSPAVAGNGVCVSAVERSPAGAIKLQLVGDQSSDWAEWHPESSCPQSFVGGLADQHDLVSALSLGRGWYLVRYDA
ncbi:hypothetical protein NHH03_20200 [Stieleria sp. TO1_6]|nr:hypothetical protein [Stieleria tagensis]